MEERSTAPKFVFVCMLTTILFISSTNSSAQYKENKLIYNPNQYTYDMGGPYKPVLGGIASLFIPGAGQMYAGEIGRGFAFLLGDLLSYSFFAGGFVIIFSAADDITGNLGVIMFLTGIGGIVSFPIWSALDASKVARVNNLAWLDKQRTGMGLNISPGLVHGPYQKIAPTLKFTLKF